MTTRTALRRWLPVVLWAGVIFAFSAVPALGTGLGYWDLLLRKLAHMGEYAVLAILLRRALLAVAPSLAVAVAYAATDELHQHFVRGRHATLRDVVIDAAGAVVGLALYRRFGQSPHVRRRAG